MGTLVTALFFINTEVIDSKLEVRDKVCECWNPSKENDKKD